MYYRALMSKEEKQQAKVTFLQIRRGNFIFSTFMAIPAWLGIMFSFYLIKEASFTYRRTPFILGWAVLPIFVYHWFDFSRIYKYSKPLKKLKKPDRQFADTQMDEIIIDDEKVTINESFSVFYKDVKTAMFTQGFVALIDRKKQPVIIKTNDEAQIRLYSLLTDRRLFRRKKQLLVSLENPKAGYYISEIEEKRKLRLKKKNRKDTAVTIALIFLATMFSAEYVNNHPMEENELLPGVEYTYTEGEDLHDMLEKAVEIGGGVDPILDIYTDYAEKEFDCFIKNANGKKGLKQLSVCIMTDENSIYIMTVTDNPAEKERTVYCEQSADREKYVKAVFELDYVQEKYPFISNYLYWIRDGWKITLKDDRLFTFNDKGIYRLTDNTASFEEKGEELFSVQLVNCGKAIMPKVQAMFEKLEQERKKPYDEQDISIKSLEKEIRHYILAEEKKNKN